MAPPHRHLLYWWTSGKILAAGPVRVNGWWTLAGVVTVVELSPKPPAEAVFAGLYREFYRSVHGYVRSVYPSYDADDVTSKVFEIAWRRFDHIPMESQKAWLFGVMRNILRNEIRARQRNDGLIDAAVFARPTTATSQNDEAVSPESVEELVVGFNQLRDPDREILLLAAWGGLDAEGLAVTLGINKNAATVRLSRARQRLREAMDLVGDNEMRGQSHDGAA
jgi:RNA polymerase sigma-70 factor, ECF subfamily